MLGVNTQQGGGAGGFGVGERGEWGGEGVWEGGHSWG